jgi:NitT/TauT family transport system substrate-binding protein
MRKFLAIACCAGLLLAGCRGTSPDDTKSGGGAIPSIKIMVGGIDKVIYLPAKLTE